MLVVVLMLLFHKAKELRYPNENINRYDIFGIEIKMEIEINKLDSHLCQAQINFI